MEKIKNLCQTSGRFKKYVYASLWEECIALSLFNYQENWYIRAEKEEQQKLVEQMNLEKLILPMFEEILQFENKEIVYTLLYVSNNLPIKHYTKHYHFETDADFDILVKSSKIGNKNVSGLIKKQLNIFDEVDSLESLKSTLKILPYNFKGLVVHNQNNNDDFFYYADNFLSAKGIIDNDGDIKEHYFDLFKRGELQHFIEDYPEYKKESDVFVKEKLEPTINWFQIAFERNIKLNSEDKFINSIYQKGSISNFLKYDIKNLSYEQFKSMINDALSPDAIYSEKTI